MSTAIARRQEPSLPVAYILLFMGWFGVFGLHRFYVGRWVSGLLWLFTFGIFGIGQFVDLFLLPRMADDYSKGREVW